jgi:hypothetical protein
MVRIAPPSLLGFLILGALLGSGKPSQAQVSFASALGFPTGLTPVAVAVADLNGDGKLDLATANQGASTISVLLGSGTGSFGPKADFPTGLTPVAVAVADLDGDG